MGPSQVYCFKWNNYLSHLSGTFSSLLATGSLVDVTLFAEGKKLRTHKIVLSACSSYFHDIFCDMEDGHLVVVLTGVGFRELQILVDYMYNGELSVTAEHLPALLDAAKTLKIRGLLDVYKQMHVLEQSKAAPVCDPEGDTVTVQEKKIETHNESSTISKTPVQDSVQSVEVHEYRERKETVDVSMQVSALQTANDEEEDRQIVGIITKAAEEFTQQKRKCSLAEEATEESKRRRRRKDLHRKEYSEEVFSAAVNELRGGKTIGEVATAYGIPRSTLYVKAKLLGIQVAVSRQEYPKDRVQAAIQYVAEGASLKQASECFKIPKTVLWRRVRLLGKRSGSQELEEKTMVLEEINQEDLTMDESGDLQLSAPEEQKQKERPVEAEMSVTASLSQNRNSTHPTKEGQLRKAVEACQKGRMSQAAASATFQVPKTTIWRRLQRLQKLPSARRGEKESEEEEEMVEQQQEDTTVSVSVEEAPTEEVCQTADISENTLIILTAGSDILQSTPVIVSTVSSSLRSESSLAAIVAAAEVEVSSSEAIDVAESAPT